MFTELPQLLHIVQGQMSLVGNRPLPTNVVESLRELHPDVDLRFQAPTGLTGPVQLVGRDGVSDAERLALEYAYVAFVTKNYSILTDVKILALTVAAGLSKRWMLTYEEALELVQQPGTRRPGQPAATHLPAKPFDCNPQ